MKGCDRVLVDGDMVGMTVATCGVKSEDHLRANAADKAHQARHDRRGIGIGIGGWVLILWRASHARVAIAEEVEVVYAHVTCGVD